MIKANMVMTKEVIVAKVNTTIYDAMNLLINHSITGLPVVNDDSELVGILSEKDMLNLLYNEQIDDKTVGDYMTKNPMHFKSDDSIVDVCDCLINNFFRRVPITENNKLVGIISRRDIIAFILKLRHKATH